MTKIDKTPYLPLYGKDIYTDVPTLRLSLAHQGLYLRLLWWQWSEGAVPDDVEAIIEVVGKPDEVRALWPKVREFFTASEAGLQNKTLEGIRHRLTTTRKRRSKAGSKGGSKTQANRLAIVKQPIADADAKANAIGSEWDQLVRGWSLRVGAADVARLIDEYPDKPPAYIEKCVATIEQKRALPLKRGIDPSLVVGAPPVMPAKDQLRELIDVFRNKHGIRPSELHVQKRADWDRHFELDFGFSPEDFIDASEDQCAVWLADLGVTV